MDTLLTHSHTANTEVSLRSSIQNKQKQAENTTTGPEHEADAVIHPSWLKGASACSGEGGEWSLFGLLTQTWWDLFGCRPLRAMEYQWLNTRFYTHACTWGPLAFKMRQLHRRTRANKVAIFGQSARLWWAREHRHARWLIACECSVWNTVLQGSLRSLENHLLLQFFNTYWQAREARREHRTTSTTHARRKPPVHVYNHTHTRKHFCTVTSSLSGLNWPLNMLMIQLEAI